MNIHAEFFEGGLCTFKYECGGKNMILGVVHRVLLPDRSRKEEEKKVNLVKVLQWLSIDV